MLDIMTELKYTIKKIDKTSWYTPKIVMPYPMTLEEAENTCKEFNESEKNENFEYKVCELKEV